MSVSVLATNRQVASGFIGTFVDCPSLGSLRILQDHVLLINNEGFIASLHPVNSAEGQSSIILAREQGTNLLTLPKGSFLLPTFCDLHLHAPQYLYQGTGLHLPLLEWLNQYAFKAEERLDSDPELAKKVYERLGHRLKEHGTGAVLLFGTIKPSTNLILANAMQAAGIRALVGKVSMDISSRETYKESSSSEALRSASSFSHDCRASVLNLPPHERLVEPVLTPRFVPTCSDELLNGLGSLSAEQDLRVQSHMAEARDQVDWVRVNRGMDDIEIFDKYGLLTDRTIQAHCTFLPPPSLSYLHERGSAVAHCPLSNAYFSSQPFRLREALDLKVKVGLGTDIAGGYSIDIMNAMRSAVVTARIREGQRVESTQGSEGSGKSLGVDWKETLYIATRGGADALNIAGLKGYFQEGGSFDAQMIYLSDSSSIGVGPLDWFDNGEPAISEETVEKWWCNGDSRNRAALWVQGKRCYTGPLF